VVDVIQILIQSLFNFIQSQDQTLKGGENFDKIFTEALKDILKNFKSDQLGFQDIIDELIKQGNLQNQDENSLKQLLAYIQKNFQSVNSEDRDSSGNEQNKQDGEKSGINISSLDTLFYFNFVAQNSLNEIKPDVEVKAEKEITYELGNTKIEKKIFLKEEKEITYELGNTKIEKEIFLKDGQSYQNLKISDSNSGSNINVDEGNAQDIKGDIVNENKQNDELSDVLKNAEQVVHKSEKNTNAESEKNAGKKVDIHLESNGKLGSDDDEKFKFKEKKNIDKNSDNLELINKATTSPEKIRHDKDSKGENILNFQDDMNRQNQEKSQDVKVYENHKRQEEISADKNHKDRENIMNLSNELEKNLHEKIGSSHDSVKSDDRTGNSSSHLKSENLNFVKPNDSLKSDIRAENNLKEAEKASDQFQVQISQRIEELKKVVLEAVRVSYGTFQKRAYVEANIFGSKVVVDVSLDPSHNVSISIATQDSALRAEISKHQDDLQRFLKDNNFTLQSFNVGVDIDNKGGSENFISYKDIPPVQSFYAEKLYEEKISHGTLFANVKGRVSFFV
jgi:hypothetical protein